MQLHTPCDVTREVSAHLERDDEVEEEDHVDDAVDDRLLDRDDEKHGRADEDPVLAAEHPQEVA